MSVPATDPLSLIYDGIITGMLDDEFIKKLHEDQVVFLDFLPLPDVQGLQNPPVPAKDMPRVSLMPESVTWGANNSCTGRIDYVVNIKIAGYHTRSAAFHPLVFHFLRMTRTIDKFLRMLVFDGRPLQTVSKAGSATFEHDDERLLWICTIPIEIQIYM
jgi:hypothetical protein